MSCLLWGRHHGTRRREAAEEDKDSTMNDERTAQGQADAAGRGVDLDTLRHSAAHLMAHAVLDLFPGRRRASARRWRPGSTTTSCGPSPSPPTTWPPSKPACTSWPTATSPSSAAMMPKAEAVRLFTERGQTLKVELILEKGGDERLDLRPGRASSTSAWARTSPRPACSSTSSCCRSRAPTGRATSATSRCSASTAPSSRPRPSSRRTSASSRKPASATTAGWAPSWTCTAPPRTSAAA